MTTARVLLAFLAALILAAFAAPPASAQGTLTGDIPPAGGVVPVQWSGGSIDALRAAAEAAGCDLSAVLLPIGGSSVVYAVGAPAFVNAEWSTQVGPAIEATPLSIVCATPGLESCRQAFSGIFDYVVPGPEVEDPRVFAETSWEALDLVLESLGDLPDGMFVEADVSDSGVVWELVAHHGGAVAGRLTTVRDDFGWWLDGGVWCFYPVPDDDDDPVVDNSGFCDGDGPVPELTIPRGTLPANGFAFVRTESALTVDDFGRALRALNLRVASVFHDGRQVFFVCRSPSAVNKPFHALFPDGLPPGQILTVRIED